MDCANQGLMYAGNCSMEDISVSITCCFVKAETPSLRATRWVPPDSSTVNINCVIPTIIRGDIPTICGERVWHFAHNPTKFRDSLRKWIASRGIVHYMLCSILFIFKYSDYIYLFIVFSIKYMCKYIFHSLLSFRNITPLFFLYCHGPVSIHKR